MTITLRASQPADLPRLCQIAIDAFDGVSIDQAMETVCGPSGEHDWQWRKARQIAADVARQPTGVFVAIDEASDSIVAFVTSWEETESGIGYIPNLCVASGWRGQGLGRRLVQHVLDQFRQQGLTHARIETLAHNAAGYGLYTSLGFREIARQVHFAMDLTPSHRGTTS